MKKLFKRIADFFSVLNEERKITKEEEGYTYAQAMLNTSPHPLSTYEFLAAQIESAKDFDEYNEFDSGIQRALDEFDEAP